MFKVLILSSYCGHTSMLMQTCMMDPGLDVLDNNILRISNTSGSRTYCRGLLEKACVGLIRGKDFMYWNFIVRDVDKGPSRVLYDSTIVLKRWHHFCTKITIPCIDAFMRKHGLLIRTCHDWWIGWHHPAWTVAKWGDDLWCTFVWITIYASLSFWPTSKLCRNMYDIILFANSKQVQRQFDS